MAMLPYVKISDNPEDTGIHAVQLDGYDGDIALVEHYCVKKNCDCTEMTLQFMETDKFGLPAKQLFTMRLDYAASNFIKETIKDPSARRLNLPAKVKEHWDDEWKATVSAHAEKARAFVQQQEHIPSELVRESAPVEYEEVFGESPKEFFEYAGTGRKFIIRDSYCMNPKCKCETATLTFIEQQPVTGARKEQFTIRYHLRKSKVEVMESELDKQETESTISQYLEPQKRPATAEMQRRYDRMKAEGKRILLEEQRAAQSVQAQTVKVERNDPCPCGSGKKYKKCCGVAAS